MPYITNGGIRIHYEVEGAGSPLVLQHGYTASLTDWYEQGYVDALKQDRRLILVNARGHGDSDKPHAPEAYKVEDFVADIVTVLDDLGIDQADYFGYSMGGWIGFGLAQHAADRTRKIIVGGASPFPFPPGMSDPFMPVLMQGAPALLAFYEGYLTPALEARLRSSDMEALIPCRQTRFASPGFEPSLAGMRMPCLLLAGDLDAVHAGAEEAAKRMPNATFVSLPGRNHVPALMHSEEVLPHVAAFLAPKS